MRWAAATDSQAQIPWFAAHCVPAKTARRGMRWAAATDRPAQIPWFAAHCVPAQFKMDENRESQSERMNPMQQRIDLNGIWQYQPLAWTTVQPDGSIVENTKHLPPAGQMALPMNWQVRGLDTFDGRVRFTHTFPGLAREVGERTFLVFRGVDYFADVTLNEQHLGRHAGYFQPFEFEVTELVRTGDNQLQVDVDCPKEEPGSVWPDHKWLIKGILNHWDARPGSWDPATGQEKNSGGIWGDVYLEARPAAFVSNVRAAATLAPKEASDSLFNAADEVTSGLQAIVRVELDVDSTQSGFFPLRVTLDDHAVEQTIQVQRGRMHHVVMLHVADPRLWWPWDIW